MKTFKEIFWGRSSAAAMICSMLVLVLFSGNSVAQRYPATTSIQLIPPYPVNVEDYARPGNDRVLASVVFNDFSQSSWNVKFRITIEGSGIVLQTNPEAIMDVIRLTPGIPEQFTGYDIAQYFNLRNLRFQGITAGDIITKGGLPEGNYTFTLEAVDARTGIVISNKAIARAWLILNDPPQITFPICGDRIPFGDPQNIAFQWLPMHASSPNVSLNTEYEFTLVEVPAGINANEAILSAMPILQTSLSSPNFIYGISEPLLENGKTYAFRIRAMDGEGLSLFKNDGYSQVCWFNYGYPTNGMITIARPFNDALISASSQPVFSWGAPNNLSQGQPVSYELKIFETSGDEDPIAVVLAGTPVFVETTPEMSGSAGWSRRMTDELEPEKKYIWQVRGFTGEIEIAASPPARLSTTPVIQEFLAGPHVIRIVSISNQDLENFSGNARVKLLEDGTELGFDFSGLKIVSAAGKLLMNGGEINFELPESFDDIELGPSDELNGSAWFRPKAIHITRNGMSISGTTEWALPFPAVSGQQAWVKSELSHVNFDNLKLNGYVRLDDANFFNLLDPFGFDIKLLPGTSNFFLRENQYTQNFDGEVTLPESVRSGDGYRIKTSFTQAHQLFYNETGSLDKPIVAVKGIALDVVPKKIIIDFSESVSPEKHSSASWKGLYFSSFDVVLKQELDPTQIRLNEVITLPYTLTVSDNFKAWVDGEGLDLSIDKTFETDSDHITFNQFTGKFSQTTLSVENSQVMEGGISGSILIPFLDGKYFDFIVPVSNEGFEEGYLREELAGQSFTMSPGTSNEVLLTIEQATFASHERLGMVVGLAWPSLSMEAETIDGFNVWGNGIIGFGEYFGRKALGTRVEGNLKEYPILATDVGAGYHNGQYFFNVDVEISISEDLSGPFGPTKVSLYTVAEITGNKLAAEGEIGYKIESIAGVTEAKAKAGYNLNFFSKSVVREGNMLIDSTFVKYNGFVGKFEGYLKFTENDPDWGNSWQGSFLFDMRVPLQMNLQAAYVSGRAPEGFDYWLIDVGLGTASPDRGEDAKLNIKSRAGSNLNVAGGGVPKKRKFAKAIYEFQDGVKMGPVSLVGFDFRLYKSMRHSDPGDVSSGVEGLEMTFEPDASVLGGVYGRVALIDEGSKGQLFKFDVALEYTRLLNGKGIYAFEGNLELMPKGGGGFTGAGKVVYNEENQHWLGDFWMAVNMSDKLCFEAGLAFDVKPGYWKIGIGSPERRFIIIPKCQGWAPTGYFIIDPNEFEAGLGVAFVGSLSSGEINIIGNKFTAKLDYGFSAGIVAGIQYQPSFAFKKAGLWAEVWGAAAFDYTTWFSSGTWVFASIKVAGQLTVYFEDQTRVEGTVAGEVEVIGIGIDFEMGLNHTFS